MHFFQLFLKAVASTFYRGNGFFSSVSLVIFLVSPLAAESTYEVAIIEAAQEGNAQAQYALGLLYEYGGEGIGQNSEKAIYWLTKAGRKKVGGACLYLGLKYENGNGVKQNSAQAFCWYLCAAKLDWPMAQFFLADLYEKGKGVAVSPFTALAWFGLANEHGYPKAEAEFLRLQEKLGDYDVKSLKALQEKIVQGTGKPCN